MQRIIGLCGEAGSGKDFTHIQLKSFFPFNYVQRVALADEVRRECSLEVLAATGAVGLGLDLGVWNKPYTEAQRAVLQWWGTDFRRAQDPEYWVKAARKTILASEANLVVVTDVRFANEAKLIRNLGGIVVKVRCTDEVRAARLGTSVVPAHASENIDFEHDSWVSTENEGRVILGTLLTEYLGLPTSCTKCRTLYRDHPWHDDGSFNEGNTIAFNISDGYVGP